MCLTTSWRSLVKPCACIIALEDDLRLRRALRATANIDFYRYQASSNSSKARDGKDWFS